MKRIEGEVPFGQMLLWWLEELQNEKGIPVAQLSHRFDRPYLAWESVRLARNPFFAKGTGFEGYLVGRAGSAEEALDYLLALGRQTLDSQTRLYRYQPGFRRRLMRTLRGERADLEALREWAVTLGALLARLRAEMRRSPQAEAFRHETYRQVEGLPPIQYLEEGDDLKQVYEIRDAEHPSAPPVYVDPNHLRSTDQEAWQVAAKIGKFGHPLVREVLLAENH
ncbi:hypothetical protein [Caldilinea sp.]|uniref:hypothetical protein n=1 Tax=Caldilinea sp. TaxID=2293560 RepID=UPI0026233B2E|nr:hypothetical protein [uncultured Caldilinea sp.]